MATKPEQRFAGMDELLAALQTTDPVVERRWRWIAAASAGAALAVAVPVVWIATRPAGEAGPRVEDRRPPGDRDRFYGKEAHDKRELLRRLLVERCLQPLANFAFTDLAAIVEDAVRQNDAPARMVVYDAAGTVVAEAPSLSPLVSAQLLAEITHRWKDNTPNVVEERTKDGLMLVTRLMVAQQPIGYVLLVFTAP
jgi:hypothetical protein